MKIKQLLAKGITLKLSAVESNGSLSYKLTYVDSKGQEYIYTVGSLWKIIQTYLNTVKSFL